MVFPIQGAADRYTIWFRHIGRGTPAHHMLFRIWGTANNWNILRNTDTGYDLLNLYQ
jgi:hypothetical protein